MRGPLHSVSCDGGPPRELARFAQPSGKHNAGPISFHPYVEPGDPENGSLTSMPMKDPSIPGARRRSALVLGATGLVGGHCLELLLKHAQYERVVVLTRRALPVQHPKLTEVLTDFDRLEERAGRFQVDDVFCSLGTTIRKAGSKNAFRRVDLGYPREAARLASEGEARAFILVSSVGADPSSRMFYNRVKGESERAVMEFSFALVVILRPSLLLGEREELRPGEKIAQWITWPVAPLMIGPLARYRPVPAREVARAMIRLALLGEDGVRIVESEEIPALAG